MGDGWQRKLATIDVALMLDVLRPFAPGQTGTARITISKDKIGGVRAAALGGKVAGEFVLVSEGDDVLAEVRPVEFAPETADDLRPSLRRILDALPAEPPGITVQRIGDAVADGGHPLKRSTIPERALGPRTGRDGRRDASRRGPPCDVVPDVADGGRAVMTEGVPRVFGTRSIRGRRSYLFDLFLPRRGNRSVRTCSARRRTPRSVEKFE